MGLRELKKSAPEFHRNSAYTMTTKSFTKIPALLLGASLLSGHKDSDGKVSREEFVTPSAE
jgi:hypothetical protein